LISEADFNDFFHQAVDLLLKDSRKDPSALEAREEAEYLLVEILVGVGKQNALGLSDGKRKEVTRELQDIQRCASDLVDALDSLGLSTLMRLSHGIEEYYSESEKPSDVKFRERCQDLAKIAKKLIPGSPGPGRPFAQDKFFSVMLLYEIFDRYRPGQASTYDDGDFKRFCEMLYEAMTGEREPNLTRSIKRCLAVQKLQKQRAHSDSKRNLGFEA